MRGDFVLLSALLINYIGVGGICTTVLMNGYYFIIISLALLCCCVLPILCSCCLNKAICAVLGSCSVDLILLSACYSCPAYLRLTGGCGDLDYRCLKICHSGLVGCIGRVSVCICMDSYNLLISRPQPKNKKHQLKLVLSILVEYRAQYPNLIQHESHLR